MNAPQILITATNWQHVQIPTVDSLANALMVIVVTVSIHVSKLTNAVNKLIIAMTSHHASTLLLVASPVNVLLVTEVMVSNNAMKSTNAPKKLTLVILMQLVIILMVVTIVHAMKDGKVMVSPVSILMNVLLVYTPVMNSAFAPIPLAHTTAHAMMDIWVMDFCVPFPVQHSTTDPKRVS